MNDEFWEVKLRDWKVVHADQLDENGGRKKEWGGPFFSSVTDETWCVCGACCKDAPSARKTDDRR